MAEKYDTIGKDYNQTRKADTFLTERYFHHLVTRSDGRYLDIGCGTGNYTIALSNKGLDFIGVEPSIEMQDVAKSRSSKVNWISGKAENIPLENEAVDCILATLTTHHWENLEAAFRELNRILKPNGKFVIFTSNEDLMKGYWLNHYFPTMLNDSMRQMPTFEATEKALKLGGFEIIETEKYFVREDLEDLFLYSGKFNPKIYLDENFRSGISSFSDLANVTEVEQGLRQLEKDIETGKVSEIIEQYENDLGDYLFIIAIKKGQK